MYAALADYPLLDEDHHSHLEIEAQNEAWESSYQDDAARALNAKIEAQTGVEVDLDDYPDKDDLWTYFWETADRIGEYWENEQGDSMYLDVKAIVEAMDVKEIKTALAECGSTGGEPVGDSMTPQVKADLQAFLRGLIKDYRKDQDFAPEGAAHDPDDGDDRTSMQVTIATDNGESWSYQTGDTSYMGGAYGCRHWATLWITDDSKPAALVADVAEQWSDSMAEADADVHTDPE
jgi:hypothetical protein